VSSGLVLTMAPARIAEFFPLLQQGVVVQARVGCTLDRLLSQQWDIAPDYVAQRVTTIFLNGRAIDDITTAVVREGSVIALSGAMPGLVGATMRRGGFYAAMREGITYRENAAEGPQRLATVRVKLFNLLLPELGPGFLQRGIVLAAAELANFLGSTTAPFRQGCHATLPDGTPVTPERLQHEDCFHRNGTVHLRILFKE
jgi:hypothetical protein